LKRALLALSVLFAAGANAREPRLPVPPIPPAEAPAMAAPVPDLDAVRQFHDVQQSMVTLDTGINHRAAPASGLGYAPGAHYQLDNDRRWLVLPGLMLHVPLP
jgi:hypothetical protein